MRRIALPILSLMAVACSKDIDEIVLDAHPEEITVTTESTYQALVFEEGSFTVPEHSKAGSSIGFLKITDGAMDKITYALECDTDIEIDEHTGELKVGSNLDLDYESAKTLKFSVSAFDGSAIAEKTYALKVQDIDETNILTAEEQELVDYFQYLSLWQAPQHNTKDTNRKWDEPMKLHLDGTITASFKAMVEGVIAQYNALMTSGDFQILLEVDTDQANAHLYFGDKHEIEDIWPDMFDLIKDGTYDGYAKTPSKNDVLRDTRIWLSNPLEALFKHELGHALGLGHSNKCDDANSFLCSKIGSANDILPIEEDVIRYLYHEDMPAGLSETEMEKVLANLIVGEK